MKFLADENFPGPSVKLLRSRGIDIKWILEYSSGVSDSQIIEIANLENRTILTHDSDYGELIFKEGMKVNEGVIYFRLADFFPNDPATLLLTLLDTDPNFKGKLMVIDNNTIRERKFN